MTAIAGVVELGGRRVARNRPDSPRCRFRRGSTRSGMTAIAGVVALDGRRVDREELRRLAASVPGEPAEVGTWTEDGVGLAVSGTPVTPEAAGESQPLLHEESGCALVFDGRLDNRVELERQLRPDAGVRALASDARLVLAAYLAWGIEAPKALLGDFALAVWDPRLGGLVLARDPMGIRPRARRSSCSTEDGSPRRSTRKRRSPTCTRRSSARGARSTGDSSRWPAASSPRSGPTAG